MLKRVFRPFVLVGLALVLAAPTPAAQTNDVDLVGGAYNEFTSIPLSGTPGRKYLLMISVINIPGFSFIPNLNFDVGLEFLNFSFGLPGFVGTFDGSGNATAALVVPYFVQLDTFPLYFQVLQTGPIGNILADKSDVQKWTLQLADSYKAPQLGGNYTVQRSTHSVTTLSDETVITIGGGFGGITNSYGQDTAEVYDLKDETLTLLPNTMVQARTAHTATLLLDGRILLTGGADDLFGEPTDTAEVYDPVTQTFSAVGSLVGGPRALHRATLLDDGRVLLTGGTDNYLDPTSIILGSYRTTEIFDPNTDTFAAGPNMQTYRLGHTATKLDDGNVLIVGGYSRTFIIILFFPYVSGEGEIYNYSAGNPGSFGSEFPTFTLTTGGRFGHAAVKLDNGDVLIVGGAEGSDPLVPVPELSWELYKPATGFTFQGAVNDGRILPTANLLLDGTVLIAGGASGTFTSPISVATSEVWDPIALLSSVTASMLQDRAGHMAVSLEDGTVLMSGGGSGDGVFQDGVDTLEIYQP
jgi:hypothetical protein